MSNVSIIGLDIAKNVFQVHGIDDNGRVVIRRQLRRRQVLKFFTKLSFCLIGIEVCGTAYYWARELRKLGHEVRLMPARYVKPYVKRNKNDAADADAICEAATRPTMRFVPIKTEEQQSVLMPHTASDQFADIDVRVALERVGLDHLMEALDRDERWDKSLSLDEQQRVAFARLLLQAPRCVLLDDAMGALNEDHRRLMLSIFENELAGTTMISIGSKPADDGFYNRVLHLLRVPNGARLQLYANRR